MTNSGYKSVTIVPVVLSLPNRKEHSFHLSNDPHAIVHRENRLRYSDKSDTFLRAWKIHRRKDSFAVEFAIVGVYKKLSVLFYFKRLFFYFCFLFYFFFVFIFSFLFCFLFSFSSGLSTSSRLDKADAWLYVTTRSSRTGSSFAGEKNDAPVISR